MTEETPVIWEQWITRWQAALSICRSSGGDASELIIAEPASEEEIQEVEQRLGYRLPASFRQVLQEFSASIEFHWQLDHSINLPAALHAIFSGECFWSLKQLVDIDGCRDEIYQS